jgi:hypothetical protein
LIDDCLVLSEFAPGNYSFIVAGGRPFSSGVVADPGFDLVHVTFSRCLPLGNGLEAARRYVESVGRPATALAGFELRIPEPFSREGFAAFNAPYVERMVTFGLRSGTELVTARTNVAPTVAGVTEPSLYAFTYTVPRVLRSGPAFRLSGATEATPEGSAVDRSQSILAELDNRMVQLGVSWDHATAVNVYGAACPPMDHIASGIGSAALHGLTWFPSRPPIRDFEFEIDARGVGSEIIL